jgi:hypothetical protein
MSHYMSYANRPPTRFFQHNLNSGEDAPRTLAARLLVSLTTPSKKASKDAGPFAASASAAGPISSPVVLLRRVFAALRLDQLQNPAKGKCLRAATPLKPHPSSRGIRELLPRRNFPAHLPPVTGQDAGFGSRISTRTCVLPPEDFVSTSVCACVCIFHRGYRS